MSPHRLSCLRIGATGPSELTKCIWSTALVPAVFVGCQRIDYTLPLTGPGPAARFNNGSVHLEQLRALLLPNCPLAASRKFTQP